MYQLPTMNHPVHPPVADFGRVPDTRQRKLGEHTCDGKKVCLGLGSGFCHGASDS